MKINWKKIGIELESWKIPDDVIQVFQQDGDVGKFRHACRQFNVDEEAIDFKINEIESQQ